MNEKSYTPIAEEVRMAYATFEDSNGYRFTDPELYAEFDRWLKAHDAEVAVKALRDASSLARAYSGSGFDTAAHVADILTERAAGIEAGA